MLKTPKRRHLADAHSFPGFRAGAIVHGRFGDPQMRVVTLARRTKKRTVELAGPTARYAVKNVEFHALNSNQTAGVQDVGTNR